MFPRSVSFIAIFICLTVQSAYAITISRRIGTPETDYRSTLVRTAYAIKNPVKAVFSFIDADRDVMLMTCQGDSGKGVLEAMHKSDVKRGFWFRAVVQMNSMAACVAFLEGIEGRIAEHHRAELQFDNLNADHFETVHLK